MIHFLFDRKVRQLDLTYASFSCQVIAILLKSPVLTKQRVYTYVVNNYVRYVVSGLFKRMNESL